MQSRKRRGVRVRTWREVLLLVIDLEDSSMLSSRERSGNSLEQQQRGRRRRRQTGQWSAYWWFILSGSTRVWSGCLIWPSARTLSHCSYTGGAPNSGHIDLCGTRLACLAAQPRVKVILPSELNFVFLECPESPFGALPYFSFHQMCSVTSEEG